MPFPYRRIVAVGATSSGKSTLARELSAQLELRFVELDALYWQADWTPASLDEFRRSVEVAVSTGADPDGWVIAGNYHVVRDLIWPRAEAVIWLDYSLPVVFWRLLVRTLRRSILQEELWNGNRERFWWHLKLWSDESLFHWLFKTYWRRKREYPLLFAWPEHAHLQVIHFRSPDGTRIWFAGL